MKLHVLGIDLGKTVFHLVGLDSTGRLVIRKRDVLAGNCWHSPRTWKCS